MWGVGRRGLAELGPPGLWGRAGAAWSRVSLAWRARLRPRRECCLVHRRSNRLGGSRALQVRVARHGPSCAQARNLQAELSRDFPRSSRRKSAEEVEGASELAAYEGWARAGVVRARQDCAPTGTELSPRGNGRPRGARPSRFVGGALARHGLGCRLPGGRGYGRAADAVGRIDNPTGSAVAEPSRVVALRATARVARKRATYRRSSVAPFPVAADVSRLRKVEGASELAAYEGWARAGVVRARLRRLADGRPRGPRPSRFVGGALARYGLGCRLPEGAATAAPRMFSGASKVQPARR